MENKNPKSKYYKTQTKSQNQNPKKIEKYKIHNIRDRTFEFSKRILTIAEMLPENKIYGILQIQLVKSGTSICANIEEGDGAFSKRDFINKIVLARKEAKETKYWLRLIQTKNENFKNELENDIQEINEIIKILSAIINNSKRNHKEC
jgi:four helix bundle protein